jgi:hypothetical protein
LCHLIKRKPALFITADVVEKTTPKIPTVKIFKKQRIVIQGIIHGLSTTPAFIHSISRLEAFLFLEYIAVTVHALVERDLRNRMKDNHLEHIPMYPEARDCRAPTAERVFEIFEHVQMHILMAGDKKIQTFHPDLSKLQLQLLDSLGISPAKY